MPGARPGGEAGAMEAVVVPTKRFDAEFERTLKELELDRFKATHRVDGADAEFARQLHRKFHYEVSMLRDRLKDA